MPATLTSEQVESTISRALESFGADPATIRPDAPWGELDVDSLDLVELAQVIEDEFGVEIRSQDVQALRNISDVVELVIKRAA